MFSRTREAIQLERRNSKKHCRYFKIAGITIQLKSDLPITDTTFQPQIKLAEIKHSGNDVITLQHHFRLPDLNKENLGEEIYRRQHWSIFKNNDSWIYLGRKLCLNKKDFRVTAIFNTNHTFGNIYCNTKEIFLKGNLHSLSMLPFDNIFLGRVLANKQGCILHACGVKFRGKGLVFAGQSEAGKSTMANILQGKARILNDEHVITRNTKSGFKIYGALSPRGLFDSFCSSAPLKGVLFLEKANENRLIALRNKEECTKMIFSCLIRPFVTVDWWAKTLIVLNKLIAEVPCYRIRFTKDGTIADLLTKL